MHRRDFLRGFAALAALPVADGVQGLPLPSPGRRLGALGIQLYTLREMAARDLEATLAAVAGAGYREIELLGFTRNYGHEPAEVRAMLDRHGLIAPATHVTAGHVAAGLERHLERAAVMGHRYLVVASLAADERETLDDYKAWADLLNRAGEVARRQGMWLGFHNHADDFKPLGGQVPYDVFLERTDPGIVRHEFDIGNLVSTGRDPMEYLRRYGNRYWLFHVKDPVGPGQVDDTVVGRGMMDWKRFLAAIDKPEEKHFFVEQERHGADAVEDVRKSFEYLSRLDF